MPALASHRQGNRPDAFHETRAVLARRLTAEFVIFSADTVERCVADVQACATHLGLDPTPALVERMAREHLVGMVKSEPPSGRIGAPAARPSRAAGGGAGAVDG
ncbi:hypothetical protein [Actinomadura hibisca]|uniref:hypothetical protein n=1 Tax=Actinomadura hibisca TaxID=68565 RepID=UPI000A48ADCB|nr:hypothetical protein [Actinomadura hibisca]